jgi:hypothetical protein
MIPAPGFSFFFFLVYCRLLEQIVGGKSHPTQGSLSAALEAENVYIGFFLFYKMKKRRPQPSFLLDIPSHYCSFWLILA